MPSKAFVSDLGYAVTMAMSRPRDIDGPSFAPDYVSAETLAYRLDCSISTIHSYVRRRLLPRPVKLGDLVRWRWSDVEHAISSLEAAPEAGNNDDPYLANLVHDDGPAQKTGD